MGAATSGRTCRAPSRSRAEAPGESQFLLEDVGPGTRRLCELEAGRWAVGARAARGRLQAPRGGPAGDPRRRRRGDRAARAPAGRARGRADRAARLPRRRPLRRAGTCCGDAAVASDDGSAGHHGPVTDLLLAELERDHACGRLRLRPGRHARGGPGHLRHARGAGPARARGRHGLRVRRLLRMRCPEARRRLSARVRRWPGDRRRRARPHRRARRGARSERRLLRPRAGPSGDQRLGHLRRDRGAAHVRRRPVRGVPVRRLRIEDHHPRAPRGQSAAAAVGGRGRPHQLHRPAQQGARALHERGPARAREPHRRRRPEHRRRPDRFR